MTITTDGKTNSQIFDAPNNLFLTSIQKQVRFVMKQHLQRKPCPNCGEEHNVPEAAGVAVDEYDFSGSSPDRTGPCRKCKRTLIFTLPMMGGWHWRLDPTEAQPKS